MSDHPLSLRRFMLALAGGLLVAGFGAQVGTAAASASPLVWSGPVRVDTQGAITSVSCPATTFCAAVDSARNMLTSDPANTTWPVTGTDVASPLAVSCGTPTFCAVVDAGWRAMSYTNGSWGPRVAPSGGSATSINAVSCTSSVFCFTGSGYTTTPRTLDGGATWEIQNNQGVNYPGAIKSVSCAPGANATTGFCVVVDSNNAAFVSSNGGVNFDPPNRANGVIAGASGLTSVSCTSSTACVTVDSAGKAFYFRGGVLGGADWTRVDADLGRQLRSVSCAPGSPANQTFCAAVDSGGYQIETSDGGATWTTPALITGTTGTPPLRAISCPTAGFCVATDNGGNAYIGAPQAAPANTGTAPTISNGPAQVGQSPALNCTDTNVAWTGPTPTITHRWQSSAPSSSTWVNIVLNAATQTYTPVTADQGNLLRCITTATNAGGTTDANSAATDPVLAAAPANTGTPVTTDSPPASPPAADPPGPVLAPPAMHELLDADAVGVLQAPVIRPAFAGRRKALSFGTVLPEPGMATYRLDVLYHRGGEVHRAALGQVTVAAAVEGQRRMMLRLGRRGWRILRRHPHGRLVVKTFFLPSLNGHFLEVHRGVTPARRPRPNAEGPLSRAR